jgi:hypothetical protein
LPIRSINRRYVDPLDAVWRAAAAAVGLTLARSDEVFASSDRGALTIAAGAHLDPDDCLAQMVFHELCHSLVEGPESFERRDWGLPLEAGGSEREHACLRVQAFVAAGYGLRRMLAPTTEFRAFYDQLGDDPLEPRGESSARLAIAAIRRVDQPPWAPHLRRALEATAAIAGAAAPFCGPGELLADLEPRPAPHPTGLPGGWIAGRWCNGCAWLEPDGRCLQAGAPTDPQAPACARFEPAGLDCLACAACCRSAYHSVTVDADDPFVSAHPELVADRGDYLELARSAAAGEDRCAALGADFRCAVYADRPRCCRDFEIAGENCLIARRRVGLSL